MAVSFSISDSFEELQNKLSHLQNEGEDIVNDVLWNEGAEQIQEEIGRLLPESGRTWKGKKAPAKSALPFSTIKSNLAVTINSKKPYHYLYFPDDGSNTMKHAGNQHFMLRGAENQAGNIIDLCIDRLTQAMNG